MNHFKDIHIGRYIQLRAEETQISMLRLTNFMKCSEKELYHIYNSKSVDTHILLRMSKILEYDFFRVYTQHLILYAPPGRNTGELVSCKNTNLPRFRKNIYTKEMIDFILDMIRRGEKNKNQIIEDYGIPKSTLFKWIAKNP